jgi:predicted GNAT family N-acyltransferase
MNPSPEHHSQANQSQARLVFGAWSVMRADAQTVRFEVFVDEQQVPADIELDEMDPVSLHAVAYAADGQILGTGRLLPDGHIGRMAVRKIARGTGIGGMILQALIDKARARGDAFVVLSAQTQAEPFYLRFGFMREGAQFYEAGIAHIQMRLAL